MSTWKKIYHSSSTFEVEEAKFILEERGIPTVIMNKKESVYNIFGRVELYAQQDHIIQALKFLEDWKASKEEDTPSD